QMACGEDIMNVASGLRLEGDDVRALIHIEHRLDGAEPGRVRQSDDFEITLLQHGAVISRAPLLDRRTGSARAPVKAPPGQGETEPSKGPFADIEVSDRDANVIEIKSKRLRHSTLVDLHGCQTGPRATIGRRLRREGAMYRASGIGSCFR